MSAIGPGDWVECVDADIRIDGATGWSTLPGLALGAVYRVASVQIHPVFFVETLCLDGFPGFGSFVDDCYFGGWDVRRFRPIYRPNSELIQSLLKKADQPTKVDA